jgi:hypothetical protein
MAAVAQRAPAARAPASRTRARRPSPLRRRVAGGVVWIALVAALLAGVVALNVAVLESNLRLDELGHKRARLRAENAALASKLASAAAAARIQRLAQQRLGVVPAEPDDTFYVRP